MVVALGTPLEGDFEADGEVVFDADLDADVDADFEVDAAVGFGDLAADSVAWSAAWPGRPGRWAELASANPPVVRATTALVAITARAAA